MDRICFSKVDRPYGEFCNDAPYPVHLDDKTWPTVDHYYHAQKFTSDRVKEYFRTRCSHRQVIQVGRMLSDRVRVKWEVYCDEVMLKALMEKFSQHLELEDLLLGTGEAVLVYDNRNVPYWGVGQTGKGRNRLGRLLMKTRAAVRCTRLYCLPFIPAGELDVWLPTCHLADPIWDMAMIHWEAGDLASAEKCCRRLLAIGGRPERNRLALAKLCSEQGKWRSALYHARKYREDYGDGIDADVVLAEACLIKHDDQDGYDALQRAVDSDGGVSRMHYLMARALEMGGYLRMAYHHYQRAFEEARKRVDEENDDDENWMLR